jgi:hypothetical protein
VVEVVVEEGGRLQLMEVHLLEAELQEGFRERPTQVVVEVHIEM